MGCSSRLPGELRKYRCRARGLSAVPLFPENVGKPLMSRFFNSFRSRVDCRTGSLHIPRVAGGLSGAELGTSSGQARPGTGSGSFSILENGCLPELHVLMGVCGICAQAFVP